MQHKQKQMLFSIHGASAPEPGEEPVQPAVSMFCVQQRRLSRMCILLNSTPSITFGKLTLRS